MPLDKERHLRFWRREATDRPLFTYHLGSYYPLDRYPSVAASLPSGHLKPEDISIPAVLQDYKRLRDLYAEIEDDTAYISSPLYGFPWMPAMLGCPVRASQHSRSFWADALIHDWSQAEALSATVNMTWLDKAVELVNALLAQSNGEYPVTPPQRSGVSDMMGAARGSMQLPLDCYDYPEKIKWLAPICLDIWIEANDTLQALIPPFEGGYAASDYGLWAPGHLNVTQEDFSSLLSPALFADYVLPYQSTILRQTEYNILHLHPPAIYAIDQILDLPELKAVELNYEPGGPDLDTLIPVWRRIQEKKPLCIYASHINEEDISRIVMELEPRGLALHPVAWDAEQAKRLKEAFERAVRQRSQS